MRKKASRFYELRKELTKLIIQNEAGIANNEALGFAIEQAEAYDKRIYKVALREALYAIYRMESYMMGLYVSKIIRLDPDGSPELSSYILRAGAAKKHPELCGEEEKADLYSALDIKPAQTFICYVNGASMIEADIADGDILLVKAGQKAKDNEIVVAEMDGEKLVKRLRIKNGKKFLCSENPDYPDIPINGELSCRILGVVWKKITDVE